MKPGLILGGLLNNKIMKIEDFLAHKHRWMSFSKNANSPNVDFETYMRMSGLSKEEFATLNDASNAK
jgi:hypothetical protein